MKTNEGTPDRVVRVALGAALVAAGSVVVQGAVGVVIGVVGVVPLLTGLVGWCPIYTLLKIDTLGLRISRGRNGSDAQPR